MFLTHQNAATLNRNMVLNYIKNNAPVSRTDIWEKIGLSRASATQIIKQLIEQGFVYEKGEGESRGGRKPCYLEFNSSARNIIVFDWHLKTLFLCNLNSDLIFRRSVSMENHASPNEFLDKITTSVNEIIKTQKLDLDKIIGFGLVMPGMIDPYSGTIILSSEQKWENVNLMKMIEDATRISTAIETEGNMLALGEFLYGLGKEAKDFVMLDIEEDGMGSALILGGQLQRGSNNMSGEIGHISLSLEGPKCSCGKKGCIEAFLKAALRKKSSSWKEEAASYIGLALSIVVNILDPKIAVLSGSIIEKSPEEFIASIRNATIGNVLKAENRNIRIEKSLLGKEARVKGICGLIYEKNFSNTYCRESAIKNKKII